MALFEPAFNFMMDHEDRKREGKVTFDLGGKTRFGIAEKWHKDVPAEFWILPPLDALAIAADIYRNEYWRTIRGFQIQNQRVASKAFDVVVNLPARASIALIQRAAGANVDSEFGPATLAALNSVDPDKFLADMAKLQEEHYRAHSREEDLKGLLIRAAALPPEPPAPEAKPQELGEPA